jgi:hypothetical protein
MNRNFERFTLVVISFNPTFLLCLQKT